MKFNVTFKRQEPNGMTTEWIEQHESTVVTSAYSAKKYANSQAARIRNTEVIKVELIDQRVKGTS